MGKRIWYTVIRKLIVFSLITIIGLLGGFGASLIFGGRAVLIGISATVMIVISVALLMTVVSLIVDGVLIRAGEWKRWVNLLLIIVSTFLLVYYYFLDKGIFLDLPEFKILSQIVLYGSIVLSFLYWVIDGWAAKFIKNRFSKEGIEKQTKS
ncbi:hypothetical protein MK805_03260 [Shimazuella sp. AN120528]|nr:hypothetical protein [Shimazuella soli]